MDSVSVNDVDVYGPMVLDLYSDVSGYSMGSMLLGSLWLPWAMFLKDICVVRVRLLKFGLMIFEPFVKPVS